MKRFIIAFLIIVLFPIMAFAQLSLNSINTDLHTNYHNITQYQAYIAAQGFLTSADLSNYALKTDVYTQAQADILLAAKLDVATAASTYATITAMNLKANSVDVYTTAAVDLLLLAKLDVSAISAYYTILQVDTLLADKADTASVALKIGRADYFSDTLGGSVPPSGSTSGGTVLCDDGVFRSVASVGGGVTNAVDLNTSTSLFSRIMNSTAINAQIAFDQIDANAATTAEVAAKANTADVYTKSEVNATIENAINAIPPPSVNQTVSVTAGENLTAGDVVSLINSYGTVTAKKNNLAVNTSPNGSEQVFNSAATTYCSAVALDSTRFLVAYSDSDGQIRSIVGTVSGSTISWGSESNAMEAVSSAYTSVCKIATDKVLCAYEDAINSKGRCVVLSISGTTITVGTPIYLNGTEDAKYVSASTLDTDKAIVCARMATNYGKAVVITVSGTTPTAGTAVDFNAAQTSYCSVSSLSSTTAIVAYADDGNSSYGTAQVLSISGTTITPGSEYVFNSAASLYIATVSTDSTHASVVFRDSGDNDYGKVVASSISGAAITYGTEQTFCPVTYNLWNSICKISSSKVLVKYSTSVGEATNKTVLINIDGTTATVGTPYSVSAKTTNYNGVCSLDSTKSVGVHQSDTTSYGEGFVNQWATSDFSAVRGICQTTTTSGNSAPILISGSFDGLTSLVTGSQYWVSSDFSLSTAPVSLAIMKNSSTQTGEIYFGTAKSATELIVGVDFK